MLKGENGFTLIEMLIVISIISILTILIVPNLIHSNQKIESKGCEALITVVESQIKLYHFEKNTYPQNLEQLINEGYLKEQQTVCPNGKNIVYHASTGNVTIE